MRSPKDPSPPPPLSYSMTLAALEDVRVEDHHPYSSPEQEPNTKRRTAVRLKMRSMRRVTFLMLIGPPITIFYLTCFLFETRVLLQSPTTSEFPPSQYEYIHVPHETIVGTVSDYPTVKVIRQESFVSQSLPWMTESLNIFTSKIPENFLLNMSDFKFVKDAANICTAEQSPHHPFLLTFVHSAPNHFSKRKVIRETWASKDVISNFDTKVIFVVGLSNNTVIESLLWKESNDYGDIVQGNFLDTYKNLTLKHLTAFRWVMKYCNTSKFVMKVDDDAFIDTFQVISMLKTTFDTQDRSRRPAGILACSLFPNGTAVKRSGKWAVDVTEYSPSAYPPYCSGVAYFVTPDVIFKLFDAAHHPSIRVLWIDDVFVTGILPAFIRQKQYSIGFKYTYDRNRLRSWSTRPDLKASPYLISDLGEAVDWQQLMTRLWEKTVRVWR